MSTYSPNLRIELIANGDQTGTWGLLLFHLGQKT